MKLHCRLITIATALVALTTSGNAAPDRFQTKRPDGSKIDWYLDLPAGVDRTGIIVLAQGSGCQSVLSNGNIALARRSYANLAAITVDKYGVNPGDDPKDPTDCSSTFRQHHTNTQRVADYIEVIDLLRSKTWWNGQLVLFGGSEGGDIVARLAAPVKADIVILLSTGGGSTFGELVRQSILDEMVRNSVPREKWPDVDAAFERARKDPQSSDVFAGSSYRYWADAIDYRPVDGMLHSSAALLLIQGGKDTSAPVADARKVADIFAAAGRCNLTYWEFPSFTHRMIDADGTDKLAEVLSQSAAWLKQQLAQGEATASCAFPP